MTFTEYAAAQAEQNRLVMEKLDTATETVADELREVGEKVAALEDAIRNGGIDQSVAEGLLAATGEIGSRVTALTEAVENILPEPSSS